MSRTIWRLSLETYNKPFQLYLPVGALFLTVQPQFGMPQIWFEVNYQKEREYRFFRFLETDEIIPESCKVYLGTIILKPGHKGLHLYEESKSESHIGVAEFEFQDNVTVLQLVGTA